MVVSVTSRSASLQWDPPLPDEWNGEIIHYSINVTSVDTGENFEVFSETTTVRLDDLKPFTVYVCAVAAGTSIGTGPSISVYDLTTLEDGMLNIVSTEY